MSMTDTELTELVKRLRHESKSRYVAKGFSTGPKAHSGINCEDGNAAADAIDALHARVSALEMAFASHECPRPIGDAITIAECIEAGNCGCSNADVMSASTYPRGEVK